MIVSENYQKNEFEKFINMVEKRINNFTSNALIRNITHIFDFVSVDFHVFGFNPLFRN